MGASAVAHAISVGGLSARPCVTARLPLHDSDAPGLAHLIAENPALARPLHDGLTYRAADVVWGARFELARTVEDVLARRTRALFLDARAARDSAPRVGELLARELGHDADWQNRQIRQFQTLAERYLYARVKKDR